MTKKLNWLDKFAEEQAKKLNKVASTTKIAEGEDVIVSPEDAPGAVDGGTIEYNGEQFQVVNANYQDEFGAGVVLRAAAASDGSYQGLESDPIGLAMGAPASSVTTPSSNPGQEYHRTKLDIQQTYDFDQDAQWGSSSAAATEQEIAGENSVDRTTIPGHYTKSPGLNTSVPVVAPIDGNVVPAQPSVPAPAPAPAATESVSTESTESIQEDTSVEELETETETSETSEPSEEVVEDEEKKEDKVVANRILARIRAKQG